jgi:DNA-binding MurR/RpiR family transcriptional regulator
MSPPLRPTSFEQDFAERIAKARGQLSKNDRRIVEYVRENIDELAFHTSDSLADSVGVSRAAIVRLARRLGYENFTKLRNLARDELQNRTQSLVNRFDASQPKSLFDRKVHQDIQNLMFTRKLVRDEIHKAATTIHEASVVYVLGHRETYALALYLQRMLHIIRPDVQVVDPGFPDKITRVRPEDVVVACTFRRYSRVTASLLRVAKDAGAQIIVLTDGGAPDFGPHADQMLVTATQSPTLYPSRVAAVVVIEGLVAEVAALDPGATRNSLETIQRFTHEQKMLME